MRRNAQTIAKSELLPFFDSLIRTNWMPSAGQPVTELNTWKEISAYLGVGVRTAQEYENELGLPVHRLEGKGKPRVRAFSSELDAWKLQHGLSAEPSISVQQTEPPPAAISPASSLPSKARSGASPSGVRRVIYVGLTAAIVLTLIAYWSLKRPTPISDFRVQGRNLITTDSKGRELWRHSFPGVLIEADYLYETRSAHSWIGDLDGNGSQQLIILADPWDRANVGTSSICFNADGKQRWQFTPGKPVADRTGDRMVPPYFTNNVQVILGHSPTDTRVAVSSNHYLGQANQVAFLDVAGNMIGEYWHPGHLLHSGQADLDGSGRKLLILAGVNNGNHQATLVVLDPMKIFGAVTPQEMKDHRFELLGMAPAHERAVVFFPRSCIGAGQPYTRVRTLHINKDRIVATVSEGMAEIDQGFVYELDYNLRVMNVVPTNGVAVERMHRDLEAQHKINHRFVLESECARLKAGVVVRRDSEVSP
jgi:hypothetical protein